MARSVMRAVRRGLVALSVAVPIAGGVLEAQSAKPRKWKDASGKFEIEATFVSEKDGVVTLKQTNGEEVEIELKQLSPADEAYIKTEKAAASSPFKSKSAPSPFQPKGSSSSGSGSKMPAGGGGASTSQTTSDPAPTANPVDWGNAQLLSPPDQNNFKAIAISPAGTKKGRSAQLPAKRDFFEKFTGLAAGDGFAILGYQMPDTFNKGNPVTTRLVRVNTETGKTEGTIIVDGLYSLMDVSASGDEILMRKDVAIGQQATDLEVWKPAGKAVQRQKAFAPFASDDKNSSGVESAHLAANGKIVALANNGRAGILDGTTGEPIASVPKGYAIALSPDQKYAAILSDALLIVDLNSNETVAALATDRKHGSSVGFSPDGKRIAAAAGNLLTVWDLTTGETYRDESVSGMANMPGKPLQFTSPSHVWVNGVLVDIENHLPLWTYQGVEACVNLGASTLMATSDRGNQGGTLVCLPLPHAAAQQATKLALNTPGLFAVTPGTAVSVDVSGLPDAGEQEKARAGLENALTKAGMKVTPGAPIVLKASLTSENEERQFRTFGGGFETKSVNTTKYTSKVEMQVGGQTAWSQVAVSGAAFFVTSKQGNRLRMRLPGRTSRIMRFSRGSRCRSMCCSRVGPRWGRAS